MRKKPSKNKNKQKGKKVEKLTRSNNETPAAIIYVNPLDHEQSK